MNKIFIFCFLSILSLNACKPSQEVADKDTVAQGENTDTIARAESANVPAAEDAKAAADHKDNGIYANLPSPEFPAPVKDGMLVPYAHAFASEHGKDMFYSYSDTAFLPDYHKQLLAAGFEASADLSTFLKSKGENVFIVELQEGEGDLDIRMHTTRDPRALYQDIPDRAIPYPLDSKGMAAEYAEVQPPDEAKPQTNYIFYNQSEDFIKNYEKRLSEAGFGNIRNEGETPLYTKMLDNTELTVTIDQIDGKIHIQMHASKL